MFDEQKKRLSVEKNNTKIAMAKVEDTIKTYRAKAAELAAHLNYVQGALDIIQEIEMNEVNHDDNNAGATE